MTDPQFTRRYDLDWLRVCAFGLLIFYHIGMFYVTWDWHVKSQYASAAIEPLMLLTNTWRIPLLFLVSGAAYRFATDRIHLGTVAGKRSLRLLVPLIFGMLVIVVPQVYFEVRQAGTFDGGFLEFYGRYLAFDQSFNTPIPTWNHLWYIVYLWVYSMVLLPFIPLLRRVSRPSMSEGTLPAWLVLVLPVIPLAIFVVLLRPDFPETHALTNDWWNHARYFYIFTLGFLIPKQQWVWTAIRRVTWPAIALAIICYRVYVGMRETGVFEDVTMLDVHLIRVFIQFEGWFWIVAILGLGYRYLNRPSRLLSYLNEAVYPFYILHQTIIIMLGATLTTYSVGAGVEASLIIVGTFGGCWLLYEFLIRRFGLLRLVFGMEIGKWLGGRAARAEAP